MTDTNKSAIPAGGWPVPPKYGAPISLEKAKRVMAAAEAEANANGWPMVIAIFDSSGHLKLLHRLDQANQGAVLLAQRKAQTAIQFRRPTRLFEEMLSANANGLKMLAMGDELLPVEGGLPLLENGEVIGAIGVSGMLSSQDGQAAAAGARILEG
jgi:glc operon protein GlcG